MLLSEFRESGHLLNSTVVRTRIFGAVPQRLRRIGESVALAREDIIAEYERYRALVALGCVAMGAGHRRETMTFASRDLAGPEAVPPDGQRHNLASGSLRLFWLISLNWQGFSGCQVVVSRDGYVAA